MKAKDGARQDDVAFHNRSMCYPEIVCDRNLDEAIIVGCEIRLKSNSASFSLKTAKLGAEVTSNVQKLLLLA